MATAVENREAHAAPRTRSRFFANAAILMTVAVILSFPLTYYGPLMTGSKQFGLLRHLHGLVFFAWIILYAWQANLVPAGKIRLHRELGLAGVALGGMMLPLGLWVAVSEIEEQIANKAARPYEIATYNFFDICLFGLFFAAAIYQASRRLDWHRRLVYVAAICVVGPAISRWVLFLPLPYPWLDAAPNLAADVFLAALAVHDWRSLGRLHPATLLAMLVLVPWNFLEPLIARSGWWSALAPHLYGFS